MLLLLLALKIIFSCFLAIAEVWIYKIGELNIYQFEGNSYLATDTSQVFLISQ